MTERRGRLKAAVSRVTVVARRLRPRGFTERDPRVIGAVSLVVIGALVAGVLTLNGSIFSSTYPVTARFANAVGLEAGEKVLVAGVPVGSVGGLKVDGNSVLVQLDIADGTRLPADSVANIEVQTLLGVVGVDVQPGPDWSRLLHAGSTITRTSVPFQFFEVQNAAGNLLSRTDAKALGQVVSSLAAITAQKPLQVAEIVGGLNRFTGVVDARKAQVTQLIHATSVLSSTLASRDRQLASVVDDLDKVVAGLAAGSSQLGGLIDATDQAATETASLVGRNQPKLQELLDSLHTVLGVLGRHQLDLARSVADAATAVTGFASVGYSGPKDQPQEWANIYVNLVGGLGAEQVLGPCGVLSKAMDVALGPDPLACGARTGPVPTAAFAPPTLGSVLAPLAKAK